MSMWSRFAQHLKATSYKLINKKIRKWPSLRNDKWPNCVSRSCHRVSLVLWDPSEHDHSWSFIGHLTSADATLLPQSTIHGAKGLSEYPHMASTFPHSNSQKSYICSPLRCMLPFQLTMDVFPSHSHPWLWPCTLLRESPAPDEGRPGLRQCILPWWGHPELTNGWRLHTH